MMTKKLVGAAMLACLGVAGCTGQGTANANGPGQAPSGITSSNGGGQRALGNIPNIGITNGVGTTTSAVPNGKGNSY